MPKSSFDPERTVVYFQGKFRPLGQCHVHPLTHAFQYGTGIFEGIRAYWEESAGQMFLFRVEDHYRRWRSNARLLVRGGKLITPPATENILEGITRDTVMKLAAGELKIQVEERAVARSELYAAEEVFFSGTAVEIAPVVEVDGRSVGHGRPGKATIGLQRLYRQVVRGLAPAYTSWCYPVFVGATRAAAKQ